MFQIKNQKEVLKMDKLEKLFGCAKQVEVNGVSIGIKPLKVKDMGKFKQNMNEEEQVEASKDIMVSSIDREDIEKILKKKAKDAGSELEEGDLDEKSSKELVEYLEMKEFLEIMDEVNKINGFEDDKVQKIRDRAEKAKASRAK